MPIENELRYLLTEEPTFNVDISELRYFDIQQFYINYDPHRELVSRCRRSKDNFGNIIFTRSDKLGKGSKTREIEYSISSNVYEEYREYFKIGKFIDKTRYIWEQAANATWEIDYFKDGMIIAEFELKYQNQIVNLPFKPNTFKRVNGVKEYSNFYMALKDYND